MSDALLTEISKKLSDIHVALKAKPAAAAASGGAVPPKPAAAAAGKPAAAAAAPKPAGAKPPAKAPGGKHTIDEVRALILKVANTASLGKPSAKEILKDDGGVERVADLKPENYDKVFEACTVLLSSEGGPEAPAADEDDFA